MCVCPLCVGWKGGYWRDTMLVQVIPLDASKPNVIELERVYVAIVVASDDEHGVYVLVCIHTLCVCKGLNYPKWGVNYPSWIIRKRVYVA